MDWDHMTDGEIDAALLSAAVANINDIATHQYGKPVYVTQGYNWSGKTVRLWRNGAETISIMRGVVSDFADLPPDYELSYYQRWKSMDDTLLGQCVAHINSVPTHQDGWPLYTTCSYIWEGNTVHVWRYGAEIVKMERLGGIYVD